MIPMEEREFKLLHRAFSSRSLLLPRSLVVLCVEKHHCLSIVIISARCGMYLAQVDLSNCDSLFASSPVAIRSVNAKSSPKGSQTLSSRSPG